MNKIKHWKSDSGRSVCDSSGISFRCSISAVSESPCSSDRARKRTGEGERAKRSRADNKGSWYDERKIMTLSYPFHLILFCSLHLAHFGLTGLVSWSDWYCVNAELTGVAFNGCFNKALTICPKWCCTFLVLMTKEDVILESENWFIYLTWTSRTSLFFFTDEEPSLWIYVIDSHHW